MAVTALPDLNVLPAEELRALILAQHEQLVSAEDKLTTTQEQLLSREREIEHLKLLLVKLHRMQFGRKSEKLAAADRAVGVAAGGTGIQPQRERVHAARTGFASQLVRLPVQRSPRAALCPIICRGKRAGTSRKKRCVRNARASYASWAKMSSEMLEYVPASFVVVRHVRTKLSCTKCDCIVQAEAPSRPIERGLAGPGLLAHVLVSKYCDHQPLYRQSEIYARQGCGTGALDDGRLGRRSSRLLEPLVEALRRYVTAAEQTARRRHAGAGVGAGPGQDQDGALVDVCSR